MGTYLIDVTTHVPSGTETYKLNIFHGSGDFGSINQSEVKKKVPHRLMPICRAIEAPAAFVLLRLVWHSAFVSRGSNRLACHRRFILLYTMLTV